MWFKQAHYFQLPPSFNYDNAYLEKALSALAFKPCLPSLPSSVGWIPLLDSNEETSFLFSMKQYVMLCLQVEEKVLPATVIHQTLQEKSKQMELAQKRKIRRKEKLALRDDIIQTLLPRAFTKLTPIYAYIDTHHHALILNTTNATKIETFLSSFKRTFSEEIYAPELKKMSFLLTQWLKNKDCPRSFSVEKNCVLQDPNQQNRKIRCQEQDLSVPAVQALIKEGYEVKQLALSWEDQLQFILSDDFSLRSIQYADEILSQAKENYSESPLQQFSADFILMTETLQPLFNELLTLFEKTDKNSAVSSLESLEA